MNGKHSGSKRIFTDEQEKEICKFYWTLLPTGFYPSYKETAKNFGCSSRLVIDSLDRQGYKRRTMLQTRGNKATKPKNKPSSDNPLCACGCGTPVKWISKQSLWQKYAPGHYRKQALYHDAEWLRHQYCDNLHSLEEIAALFDVSTGTILKSMKKHGIKPRTIAAAWKARTHKHEEWEKRRRYAAEWRKISLKIKIRDNHTCQLCGVKREKWGKSLQVHHIDEDKTNNHPYNLISLCSACHHPIHGNLEIRSKLVEIATKNSMQTLSDEKDDSPNAQSKCL